LGLYSVESASLVPLIVPSVMIGIPLGAYLIGRIEPEVFRRTCMSFDAWVIGFGLSKTLNEVNLVQGPAAFWVLAMAIAIDAVLLYRFFVRRRDLKAQGLWTDEKRDSEFLPE